MLRSCRCGRVPSGPVDIGVQVLRSSSGTAFELEATLPPIPEGGGGLGQLVVAPDGGIVVPRFGFGEAGHVVVVRTDGAPTD